MAEATNQALVQLVSIGTIVTSTIVLLLGIFINRQLAKIDRKNEGRRDENVLIIQSLYSIGKLAHATGLAVKSGECNGEMKKALDSYCDNEERLTNFLIDRNANKK